MTLVEWSEGASALLYPEGMSMTLVESLLAAVRGEPFGLVESVLTMASFVPRPVLGERVMGRLTGLPVLPEPATRWLRSSHADDLRLLYGEPLVWPEEGDEVGLALPPLTREVPRLVRKEPRLFPLLAAVDALRVGQARERASVRAWLRNELTWALPARHFLKSQGLERVEVEAWAEGSKGVELSLSFSIVRQRLTFAPSRWESTQLPFAELVHTAQSLVGEDDDSDRAIRGPVRFQKLRFDLPDSLAL